jgi:hypothetical protein
MDHLPNKFPSLLNGKTTQRSDAIFIIQLNLEKEN